MDLIVGLVPIIGILAMVVIAVWSNLVRWKEIFYINKTLSQMKTTLKDISENTNPIQDKKTKEK